MSKGNFCKRALLVAGISFLTLMGPAAAQTERGDSQKPVVSTYDKRPSPPGQARDSEAATFDVGDADRSGDAHRRGADEQLGSPYREGAGQRWGDADRSLDAEAAAAAGTEPDSSDRQAGEGSDPGDRAANPGASPETRNNNDDDGDLTRQEEQELAPDRGDTQKPVLRTYNRVPEAQNTSATPSPSGDDVADDGGIDERRGDHQKPVVPTYDKTPDPDGDSQDLDAIRYEQNNEANDGREPRLQMRVLEEAPGER